MAIVNLSMMAGWERRRSVMIGVGVLIALILAVLIAIPLLLNADAFRNYIEGNLSSALGRKVTLGKLHLSVWSGGLVAHDAAIADDPAFSSQPFLKAPLLRIRVQMLPLLLRRELQIEGFTLTNPQLSLVRGADGRWNYSSLGASANSATPAKQSSNRTWNTAPHLSVSRLDVSGARLVVASSSPVAASRITAMGVSPAASPENRSYDQLSLQGEDVSLAKPFRFSLATRLPGAGSISVNGTAGPLDLQDLALTSITAHLQIRHLDPVAAGISSGANGLTGLIAAIDLDGAWNGHLLEISKLLIDAPRLAVIRPKRAALLMERAAPSPSASAPSNDVLSTLSAKSVEIKNATVTVTDSQGQGPPAVYSQVNAEITNFSPTTAAAFTITAQVSGKGSLNASGTAGPIPVQGLASAPVDAQISLQHVNLAASGFLPPGSGVAGLLNLDAKATSNGHAMSTNGVAHLQSLRLAANGSASPEPVDLRFSVSENIPGNTILIQHSTLAIGSALLNVAGSYQTGGAGTVGLKVDAPGVSIDQLQAFLPAVGVKLPTGSRLQGGTLTVSLSIAGPASNPVVSGPVHVGNTQLAGFDLGSKLASISALTGIHAGSATQIRSLDMNLQVAGQAVRTDKVVLDMPALGTATGSGTVSPGGALDYHLNLMINGLGNNTAGAAPRPAHPSGGIAGQLMGMLSPGAANSVRNVVGSATRGGIPVTIGGTASNPTFSANLGSVFGRSAKAVTGR